MTLIAHGIYFTKLNAKCLHALQVIKKSLGGKSNRNKCGLDLRPDVKIFTHADLLVNRTQILQGVTGPYGKVFTTNLTRLTWLKSPVLIEFVCVVSLISRNIF